MKTKMKKMMMLAVAAVLMLSLAACSGKSSNSKEPSNLDEAVAMYQELMEQENQIFAKNKKLWEKVFMEADKGMTLQEDGKNYGEFLLDTIESAKDKFTEDELKTLKSGAEEIKKIEEKLTMLEEKYPKVAEKAKENGSTSCKDGSASVPADSGNMDEFPAFEGKDLDEQQEAVLRQQSDGNQFLVHHLQTLRGRTEGHGGSEQEADEKRRRGCRSECVHPGWGQESHCRCEEASGEKGRFV